MHTSGQCSRTSLTVICIDWMCRAAKSADVNLPAQLHRLWTHCIEQSVVCSARRQPITEHVRATSEESSFRTVINPFTADPVNALHFAIVV